MNHGQREKSPTASTSLGIIFSLVWVLSILAFALCILVSFVTLIVQFNEFDSSYQSSWWIIANFLGSLFIYLGLMGVATIGLLLRNGICVMLRACRSS